MYFWAFFILSRAVTLLLLVHCFMLLPLCVCEFVTVIGVLSLNHSAVGWLAVCDCGISWSYPLTFWFCNVLPSSAVRGQLFQKKT